MATSVIQNEAGDEAEVIFGTVIDETLGDSLRVTVIATGFDNDGPEAEEEAPARRPRVVLGSGAGSPPYKGEDNLKTLDVPAYERRAPLQSDRVREDEEVPDREKAEGRRPSNVRPLPNANPPRRERINKDDTDVPAFLRRMMD